MGRFRRHMRGQNGIGHDWSQCESQPDRLEFLKRLIEDGYAWWEKNASFTTTAYDFIRLLRAYMEGSYREVPWSSVVAVAGAILYCLCPLDTVPDVIPVIGLLDDAMVVAAVAASVEADLRRFTAWSERNAREEAPHCDTATH